MKELADLNFKELDSLTKEEITELLNKEFEMTEVNSSIQFNIEDLDENTIIKFLELIMNVKSNFQITEGGEYPAKSVADIFHHSKMEEHEFFVQLKVLYLNDYIEYFETEYFNINKDSRDVIFENSIDATYQIRYNLHRLYRNHKELFNEEWFNGFESPGSEAKMYHKFLNYGTLLEKICSYQTLIRLSNKGMHYLHFVTSKKSTELMHKQEETLSKISEAKIEQTNLLDTFEQHKLQQNNNIESINTLINNHSDKIKDFYKDVTTILSLMVAAFAVIGVNISAIPKIESNFTANLLAMNLSLILCLLVLFYILRVIVYDDKINNKHFYSILSITIIGIIGVFVFLGFNHESKIDVIEVKYQEMIQNYSNKNEENISNLEKQIKQLEKELEKNKR